MDYKKYQASRNLAWQILLDSQVTELPVKITAVCRKMGIPVKLWDGPQDIGGQAQMLNGQPVILVNRNDGVPRQRFSTAHELGHILLGHVGQYELVNREPSAKDNPIEQAANVFASRLLAPACVLKELRIHSAEELARVCNISRQAAEYRYKRYLELLERDKFYLSPLERQVYQQFREYIQHNR